ncbi:kinetochore Sim4 complex subunit FTA2-domain-containing protein [Xylariaceae sp. FL0255]|nr:kinetochore Sim4 complex subunit FTA2-domain-containing protein [Xylariaceae sp. FL0255]
MASDAAENRRLLSASYLPECEGPKLGAFPYRKSPITWLEWINEKESGGQGYVFKVKIRSIIYALKVFKFFKPSTHRNYLSPLSGHDVTDSELAFHTDPFYAECRAYARIESQRRIQGLKRKDIADCYGFMGLTMADEDVLETYGVDLWQDIPPYDEYRVRAAGSPVRALVKEYIEEDVELDEKTGKHILAGIKWMHRKNILIHDVCTRNYRAGYLLDFGLSWTKPHCLWQDTPPWRIEAMFIGDISGLQEMMGEVGLGPRRSDRLKFK